MNKSRFLPAVMLTGVALLTGVAPALGASGTVPSPPATTPIPTPPAPAPAPSPAPAPPVAGSIRLTLKHVHGSPPFELVGGRMAVQGIVTPYVAGQQVNVSFYREGRKVGVKTVSVLATSKGAGQFQIGFASGDAGLVEARVAHYATPQQGAFSGRSPGVRFVNANLGPGSQGQSVRLLQSELDVLHYAVPLSGSFDEGTGRALIAFRKVTGLERIPYAGRQVFRRLEDGAGAFPVRYRGDGRHVEANLTKQVLAEIEPGGKVHAIYTTSSGKPSTPTVIGRFTVYSKTPGTNSEGMVDSNYFIRGYAIHGYAEVPTYAASHGCLRVPIPDAPAIYGWVQTGMPVDVYNQDGGGSEKVSNHAGP
jgi:peptidoglycan hydrolase-like protein with peptidoglycan-binding domain